MLGLKNINHLDSQSALPLYQLYVQKIINNQPTTISPAEISTIDSLDANIQNVLQKSDLFTQSWTAWLIQQPTWKKLVGGAAVTGVGTYGLYKLYNKYYPKK